MSIPKENIISEEAAEKDFVDVQDYIVDYLSEGQQYGEEALLFKNIEQIDLSKDEGAFETSNNCTKIEHFF